MIRLHCWEPGIYTSFEPMPQAWVLSLSLFLSKESIIIIITNINIVNNMYDLSRPAVSLPWDGYQQCIVLEEQRFQCHGILMILCIMAVSHWKWEDPRMESNLNYIFGHHGLETRGNRCPAVGSVTPGVFASWCTSTWGMSPFHSMAGDYGYLICVYVWRFYNG